MIIFQHDGKSITLENFYSSLSKHICRGDILYLEIDLTNFGKLSPEIKSRNDFLRQFHLLFRELVGDEGTIVVPSFSYSWGSTMPDKVFDIENTKGKVGIFPEYLRKQSTTLRTKDPMFSFLAEGKDARWLTTITNNSFGNGSLFEKLYQRNAKLVSFGLPMYDPTFVHYVEQYYNENIAPLGYREDTRFTGKFIANLTEYEGEHFCLMRPMGSRYFFTDKKLRPDLEKNNLLNSVTIGNGKIYISDCNSVFNTSLEGLKKDRFYLVEER